eukprot:Gregarina_sp_Poly_1__3465@NODE_2004_length_2879_cov_11_464438_g1229_i1_p2_GENE_NODE_2004_length_2879_cov_11_464438_g1229_i1NODE_2004_length_2879_cov_11_464438_g1229_i1_p2_ORF_typecomplete_len150_score16_72Spore_III_AB/PF09548_10/0_15_NODE_2004_length_2879_cov_11_464438_g1229_i1430879
MEYKILPNGLTFPEMVASILTHCNSMMMMAVNTKDADRYGIYNVYVDLRNLISLLSDTNIRYEEYAERFRYMAALDRLLLRSGVNGNPCPELVTLLDLAVLKAKSTFFEPENEKLQKFEKIALKSDFQKASHQALLFLRQMESYSDRRQ